MERKLWKKCVKFHGHECGGLTIGYKAALYAVKLLNLQQQDSEKWDSCISKDEEVVCISENDACGVDAIQVLLGCSAGKGNLLFHITGKMAFSFYNRKNGKAVRLVLKPGPEKMTREESFAYYQGLEPEEMFQIKEPKISLPKKALIYPSVVCSCCKETVSENKARLFQGKIYCLDCYEDYDRFQAQ